MGLITSIGNDRATVGQNLIDLRHGIENPDFLTPDSSPVKVAGTVKDFDVESSDPEDWIYPAEYAVPRATIRSFSPHVLYAWCAVKQAIQDASLSDEDLTIQMLGFIHLPVVLCVPSTSIFKRWIDVG